MPRRLFRNVHYLAGRNASAVGLNEILGMRADVVQCANDLRLRMRHRYLRAHLKCLR